MASVPNTPLGLAPATPKGKAAATPADPAGFARQIAGVPQAVLAALTQAPADADGGNAKDADAKAKAAANDDAAPTDAAQLAALVSQAQALQPVAVPAPPPVRAEAAAQAVAVTVTAAAQAPAEPAPKAAAKDTSADETDAPATGTAPVSGKPALAAAKHLLDSALKPAKAAVTVDRIIAPKAKAAARAGSDRTPPAAQPIEAPIQVAAAPTAADLAALAPSPTTAPTVDPAISATADAKAPAADRKLDLSDDQWLDRLARDIAQAGAKDGTLQFRLNPHTLGHLRIELSQGDHGTSVRVTADTEQARAIIADAQPRLAAEARAQGVRIAECHVDLSGADRNASGDPRRQDDARQTPLIRTARDASADGADAPVAATSPSRSDRFA